jgi:hypothetical protein
MLKDNRDEIIESLREQNSFWAIEYARLESDNLDMRIFLIITTLASIFGLSWVISDLIGVLWK